MGFRFFKRVKIFPGVTLNFSGSGPSISVGPRGLKTTFGPKGTRTTVGLPGTGLSYTEVHGASPRPASRSGGSGCLVAALLVLAATAGLALLRGCTVSAPAPTAPPPPPPPVPKKASERYLAEGTVLRLEVLDAKSARVTVGKSFQALSREDQLIRCAALWEEAFGPPPGTGELRLLLEARTRPFATFRYRSGKAEFRRLSAAPRR